MLREAGGIFLFHEQNAGKEPVQPVKAKVTAKKAPPKKVQRKPSVSEDDDDEEEDDDDEEEEEEEEEEVDGKFRK